MDHRQSQTLCARTFHVVDRMKVSPITLLHTTKLEHSSIKIHLKTNMEEETSALLASERIHEGFTNLQKKVELTTSINHQKLKSQA